MFQDVIHLLVLSYDSDSHTCTHIHVHVHVLIYMCTLYVRYTSEITESLLYIVLEPCFVLDLRYHVKLLFITHTYTVCTHVHVLIYMYASYVRYTSEITESLLYIVPEPCFILNLSHYDELLFITHTYMNTCTCTYTCIYIHVHIRMRYEQ